MPHSSETVEKAHALRRQGYSLIEIAELCKIAKSTASLWVRDVSITPAGRQRLKSRSANRRSSADVWRLRRAEYREKGRLAAAEQDPLHIMGCMLWWGEGTKDRNTLQMSNCDPELIRLWMRFLRDALAADPARIRISCQIYENVDPEEACRYWENVCSMPPGTCTARLIASTSTKIGKQPHGTCRVQIAHTALAQHVMGAVEVYGKFLRPDWGERKRT